MSSRAPTSRPCSRHEPAAAQAACSSRPRGCPVSRRFPLQPLVDLSADRVEAAERRLQALDAERRQAREKLAQVEAYRVEYRDRLQRSLAQGMGVMQVRDFQAFARQTGNELVEQGTQGPEYTHVLRRR